MMKKLNFDLLLFLLLLNVQSLFPFHFSLRVLVLFNFNSWICCFVEEFYQYTLSNDRKKNRRGILIGWRDAQTNTWLREVLDCWMGENIFWINIICFHFFYSLSPTSSAMYATSRMKWSHSTPGYLAYVNKNKNSTIMYVNWGFSSILLSDSLYRGGLETNTIAFDV